MKQLIEELDLGSKHLKVFFDSKDAVVTSFVEKTKDDAAKVAQETSRIHSELKRICSDLAQSRREPITYEFTTKDEKLRKWAFDQGEKIFGWDQITEAQGRRGKNDKVVFANKVFYP